MERALQGLVAGMLLLVQLELVGLAVGTLTPTRERWPGFVGRALAVGCWLLLALVDLPETLPLLPWAAGFALHGVAVGRSRTSPAAVVLSLAVWPLCSALPAVLLALG